MRATTPTATSIATPIAAPTITPAETITLSIRPLSASYRREATPFGLRMIEDVSELHGLLLTKS
ncbi:MULTISPECIES: hypothetical protein [Streptomyces]|uniref:ABC transporter ATP-binding protein n=1 Tax=Streptomyces griseiscabiei TaxID=2993540 RepID=A0ABU4KYL2_9ACTN|nr:MULTISPECIES: hypothetical protein [Streptomyces]MBZ3904586.1 hypothetical protein [Streptomyces griseiscabiei]MDX2908335.1 hypothetical protein [Streptomyces griseiscabiei]